MSVTVKLEGFSDLEQALGELTKVSARAVGRRALKKAGQPVADKMNVLAPEGGDSPDGPLNESYIVSTRLNKSQARAQRKEGRDDVFMYVGTNDRAGVQQEFGNVLHNPQPHARPGWEAEKFATLDRLGDEMSKEVNKAVARARRKALKG